MNLHIITRCFDITASQEDFVRTADAAHEQPESSTAYSRTLHINLNELDELESKTKTFVDGEEDAQNVRNQAFIDKILEDARHEGKNEQEIQADKRAAKYWMMLYRAGRINSLFIDYQERKEERTKKRKIENLKEQCGNW
ncbi:hypothetical protein V8C34DRAFT_303907 [Trichoderma compactum]